MDQRPIYSLFPQPGSPISPPSSSTPAISYHSRRSVDRKRKVSLDPLPPIEEPPHTITCPETPLPESPVLKPIHALHDTQRPVSRCASSGIPEIHHNQVQQRPVLPSGEDTIPLGSSSQHQSRSRPSSLDRDIHQNNHQRIDRNVSAPYRSTARDMHTPSLSSSSSTSLSKPPIHQADAALPLTHRRKPAPHLTNPPAMNTAYFHGGIGGRGNYRKVIREDKKAPLAHAQNAYSVQVNGKNGRFLKGLFSGRSKDLVERNFTYQDKGPEESTSGSGSDGRRSYDREPAALGAAEVMRRKLLRQAGVKSKIQPS